jgi:hypothetical protein
VSVRRCHSVCALGRQHDGTSREPLSRGHALFDLQDGARAARPKGTATIEITLPAPASALAYRLVAPLAGVSFALARTILATRAPRHNLAVMSSRIVVVKLMTASKRLAIVTKKLITASKRFATAIPKLMTANKRFAIAIPKVMTANKRFAIAIPKLMTAIKGSAMVIHELVTPIAGGMPRGSSAPIANAKLMTCIVSFVIARLLHSSALVSLKTAGVSFAIANMRLMASARLRFATDADLTTQIPSFALGATTGASP